MSEQTNIWCQTFSTLEGERWKVFRWEDNQETLIAESEVAYAELFDAVDAANEYCDRNNIKARWNVPMGAGA